MSLQSVKSSHQVHLRIKAPASPKCQKAVGALAISSTSIGAIAVIAAAILLIAAPLVLPIVFKAVLIGGAAFALIGTAMTIALFTISNKRLVTPKNVDNGAEKRRELRAKNRDLKAQLQQALEEKMKLDQEKTEFQIEKINLQTQILDKAKQLKDYEDKKGALETKHNLLSRRLHRNAVNDDKIVKLEKENNELIEENDRLYMLAEDLEMLTPEALIIQIRSLRTRMEEQEAIIKEYSLNFGSLNICPTTPMKK